MSLSKRTVMIETKIAQIIDATRVVLAAGEEQGVREGMEFVIYELGPEIFDPETKESLGRLELMKGRVIVSHAQEKLSTARTPSFSRLRFPLGLRDLEVLDREKLNVETRAMEYDERLTVRVGDRARSVDVDAEPAPDAVTGQGKREE